MNDSFKTPKQINPYLTKGMWRVLYRMKNDEEADGELVYEKGGGYWVGLHRTTGALVNNLLRLCLLREDSHGDEGFQVYTLNSDAEGVLADLTYVPTIVKALNEKR